MGGGGGRRLWFPELSLGEGCAESGLCASAQSQSGEGTRVLCVIINRQCISEPPSPSNLPEPYPPTNASLSLHSPVAQPCAQKKKIMLWTVNDLSPNSDTPPGSISSLVCVISRQAHPISGLMLIKNKEKGQSPLR